MTSVNGVVISIRLLISVFVQRLLAEIVGEAGIYKIGQLRSLSQILSSITSLGVFNGVVKYVAEYKDDKPQLQRLFSTTLVFTIFGTVVTGALLFFGANYLSTYLFGSGEFTFIVKLVAIVVPFISIQRVFNGVINGLSNYKKFATVELISYILSACLLVYLLYQNNITGALIAIALTPVIQVIVMLFLIFKILKEYVQFKKLTFSTPLGKSMLANSLSEDDAGIWTGMTFISKNYMVFSGAMFTLYVIPKFASINSRSGFLKELLSIYKTLLPLFGIGMILIFVFRDFVIELIYPGFTEMAPLFKWQLLGDFVRLGALVLIHQFLAKKLVRNFIFTEIVSLALFYGFANYLVIDYGVEGVVMAHFIRYILLFFIVLFLVFSYYNNLKKK